MGQEGRLRGKGEEGIMRKRVRREGKGTGIERQARKQPHLVGPGGEYPSSFCTLQSALKLRNACAMLPRDPADGALAPVSRPLGVLGRAELASGSAYEVM